MIDKKPLLPLVNSRPVDIVFKGRIPAIENGKCSFCGKDIVNFRDALSRKEYFISGACQSCQDVIFTEDEEDGF